MSDLTTSSQYEELWKNPRFNALQSIEEFQCIVEGITMDFLAANQGQQMPQRAWEKRFLTYMAVRLENYGDDLQ